MIVCSKRLCKFEGSAERSGEPNQVGKEVLKPTMILRQQASWKVGSRCSLFINMETLPAFSGAMVSGNRLMMVGLRGYRFGVTMSSNAE